MKVKYDNLWACYDCHSNNGESYRKLLDIAKTNYWRAQA